MWEGGVGQGAGPTGPVGLLFVRRRVWRLGDLLPGADRLFQHPGHVRSLDQAAQERNQRPEQVVRSILFRLAKGEYMMVLIAGPGQLSWSALRRHLGRSRLTMASEEEVLRVTGYPLGAVSPFGLPGPLPILVDESVKQQGQISIGSGVRGLAIIMDSKDLIIALGEAEVGKFGQS